MADVNVRQRWWRVHARLLDATAGVAIVVVLFLLFFLVVSGGQPLDPDYMVDSAWTLLPFLGVSIAATVISFAIGLPIGFLVGWTRTLRGEPFRKLLARVRLPDEPMTTVQRLRFRLWSAGAVAAAGIKRILRRIADGYVEVMRGTPLFVQILFMWSLLIVEYPRLENLAFIAGVLALTANTGGYQGEIFRAGLQTVHSGQIEAARSIGLTRWGAMRHVVLPQALRLVSPPLLNEFIGLFKASSLLYFIGVAELTSKYKQLASFETRIFELFAVVTILYLMFTVTLSQVVSYLERRYRIPGLGVEVPRGLVRRPGPPIAPA